MIDFIIFLLASIGLTFIVTQFYIFKNIREYIKRKSIFFGKLIHCPACFGFYSGFFIKILMLINIHQLIPSNLIMCLIYGFISSLMSYITYLLLKPLMEKYD